MSVNTSVEDQEKSDLTTIAIHELFFKHGYNIPVAWISSLKNKKHRLNQMNSKLNWPKNPSQWTFRFYALLVDVILTALEIFPPTSGRKWGNAAVQAIVANEYLYHGIGSTSSIDARPTHQRLSLRYTFQIAVAEFSLAILPAGIQSGRVSL